MKFRRKSENTTFEDAGDLEETPGGPLVGPIDAEDLPATPDGEDPTHVDLGSLLVEPVEGLDLQLQVDEASGQVQAVLLAGPEGALELRAFAAPRNGDLWSEVRPQIAADMAQRGGTATEQEGPFGTELVCSVTVEMPDGQTGTQPSRVMGINGSRWLLRATLLGRPAVPGEDATAWEEALTRVAVRRGLEAMPVGEALPVVVPPQARRVEGR